MAKNVFFFEKTPFMGVELLDSKISNYKLISYFDDDNYKNLANKNFPVLTFGNNELTRPIDSDKAVVAMFNDREFIEKIKGNNGDNLALFFYMSEEMDDSLKNTGFRLALPPYKVQEKIGNKLFISDICSRLNIAVNKSIKFKSKITADEIYKKCEVNLSTPFVVQGGLGVSGEDTFKIESLGNLQSIYPKLGVNFKASKFIKNNIPVSVHVCITKAKVFYEGPYVQIIGFKDLAKNKFQFSGNDTNQTLFTNAIKDKIFDLSMKISDYAKQEGYLGILGIDFLWDKDSDQIFVQEVNSRLVGLTRLLTGIQIEQKIEPHLIRHILEFDPDKTQDSLPDKKINLDKHDYSQIYISNNSSSDFKITNYLLPGIYKVFENGLVRTKDSLHLSDMDKDEILINYSAYKGSNLHEDQVMSKLILKRSVLSNNRYEISEYLVKLIEIIKKEMSK